MLQNILLFSPYNDITIPTVKGGSMGFFDKLKSGLNKTKESFNDKINDVFSNFRKVDENMLEELEEVLIMSDIGVDTSIKIINDLRTKIKKEKIENEEDVKVALKAIMKEILEVGDSQLNLETTPSVMLVVGVNGVRKNNVHWENRKQISKRRQKSCGCCC